MDILKKGAKCEVRIKSGNGYMWVPAIFDSYDGSRKGKDGKAWQAVTVFAQGLNAGGFMTGVSMCFLR